MGDFPTRQPTLEGEPALKVALELCRANGGHWESSSLKNALYIRFDKSYGKIVSELVHETDHLATTDSEKIEKAKEVVDCFIQDPIKDSETNIINYSQVLASLFRNYFPKKIYNSEKDTLSLGSISPLFLGEKYALTIIFSKTISVSKELKEEPLYELGRDLFAPNHGSFKKNYLAPFISLVFYNYSPKLISSATPVISRGEICQFFLQQKGVNPQDEKIFNEEFCPQLISERVAKERGVLYQALTEAKEEEVFLERLEELKESFKDEKDFLAYLESKNYTIPYLLKPVQTLKGLGDFFSIFSPDAQTRIAYRIWFHLQKNRFPNLKWDELKEISLSNLLDTLTNFWHQRAPVEYSHSTFFSFSFRKNPLTDSSLNNFEMKEFLIENIRRSLPPTDQEKFNQEISPSKLSKNL